MRPISLRGILVWSPVSLATLALVWIVPENPFRHLDDPSHWGLIGYAVALVLLVVRRADPSIHAPPDRGVLTGFLLAMPIVYVADWLRFGGSLAHLGIQLGGAAFFWTLALGSTRGSSWLLPAGIGCHAIWDLAHYESVPYVPSWYALGCAVVDTAVAVSVVLHGVADKPHRIG